MMNNILQWVKDETARMTAEWRKRRTTISMEAILAQTLRWTGYLKGSIEGQFLRKFPLDLHEEFRQTLLALEKSAAAAPDPLRYLCIALVDYAEKWVVTETIDDIMWVSRNLKNQEAQWMNELLGRRFDWVNSAATYYVSALSVRALSKYLEFNYRGRLMSPWEDTFFCDVELWEHLNWLQQQAPSRRSDAPPDDAILDEWTKRMTDKRTKDLDWFVEYYKSRPSP